MRKTILLSLILLLGFVLSDSAGAVTIQKMNGSPNDYQGWANATLVRTTPLTLREYDVPKDGASPWCGIPNAASCTDGASWIIADVFWVSPGTLRHELGHVYDVSHLSDAQRSEALSILCPACSSWAPELWADAYALIGTKSPIDPSYPYVGPTGKGIVGWRLIDLRNWLRVQPLPRRHGR